MLPSERDEFLRALGEALREERERRGLTHEVGALDERGEINPTYGTLLRVSTGLRIPIERLIAKARSDVEEEPSGR